MKKTEYEIWRRFLGGHVVCWASCYSLKEARTELRKNYAGGQYFIVKVTRERVK